ncbi:MAG: hypothetical protein IKP05_03085 [Alphaproteobacteria bacterium]|nr:hypothetical protein [Alphaproteobacteria bacterium]
MVKKILPFLCSLAPLYAFGADIVDIPASTDTINLTTNKYAVITAGTGVNVTNTVDIDGFLSVLNVASVTPPVSAGGDLYVLNTAGSAAGVFGLTSGGAMSIDGDVSIDATRGLSLNGSVPVAMTIGGDVAANGSFTVANATNFSSGAITSADVLSIDATSITSGNIVSSNGASHVVATGALNIGGFKTQGTSGNTTIGGATIATGDIQNAVGTMTITSGGVFTGSGSIENSGTKLEIDAGAMTIAGTLKNDATNGTLDIAATLLTVNGGDANNSSFVNTGVAVFNVTGATTFANGMNLSGMVNNGTTQTDSLTLNTGTLSLGTDTIIANDNAVVNITVNNGVLGNVTTPTIAISNGDPEDTNAHNNAQMTLSGRGVGVTTVYNNGGTLTIGTGGNTNSDVIKISGGVTALAGTTTNIGTENNTQALNIGGNVSNAGTMKLYGKDITLAGVSNNGANSSLIISAPTSNGSVTINNAITNAVGTTSITARDVTLHGVTNTSGTFNITGSDSAGVALSSGAITVDGGVMNLNAWAGGVSADSVAVNGGVLNLGNSVYGLTSAGNISVAGNVNLAPAGATGAGDVYLTATGSNISFSSTGGDVTVGGNIVATANDSIRSATFDGTTIKVLGANGVSAQNKGRVVFGTAGTTSTLNITNALSATNGGRVDIYSGTSTAASVTQSGTGIIAAHKDSGSIVANNGAINISNGVWFDSTATATSGLFVDTTSVDAFTLKTDATAAGTDITINNGMSVASGKTLSLDSAHDVSIAGNVGLAGVLDVDAVNAATFNGAVTTSGGFDVVAKTIKVADVTNNAGTVSLDASVVDGLITSFANNTITNSGNFTANADKNIDFGTFGSTAGTVTINSANGNVTTGAFSVSGGTAAVTGAVVNLASLNLTAGETTITSDDINITGAANITGNMIQGGAVASALQLVNTSTFDATSLTITSGGFTASTGATTYTIAGLADMGTGITVANNATANIISTNNAITTSGDITNNGVLSLVASGVTANDIINNKTLSVDIGTGVLGATSFANNTGATAVLTGTGMNLTGTTTIAGNLYQNYAGALASGDVNIDTNNYTITTSNLAVTSDINQTSSALIVNSSDVSVGGNIIATDLTINADPTTTWSTIAVTGNVSGNVKIRGLKRMTIGGNYLYDDNSMLHAAILPYPTLNYWADVSLADDDTLGQITNRDNDPHNALIYVGGRFASDISINNLGDDLNSEPLVAPQMGINLYSVVDQGSAIWLLYADGGLSDLATKIRNLKVNFCNADGSKCFNYFDSFSTVGVVNPANSATEDDLPIYLSVRDYDNDGVNDSLYIVFDPRFGGPVKVFDTESIVDRVTDSTDGEVMSANAIDEMIAGQLLDSGFATDSPIEAIPIAFADTNLSDLANELYDRMEQYVIDHNGTSLARMARLLQPREIEQFAGDVALNEHTTFRGFEDHMFDEFIWNRNRNLKKAWFDVDFGMFRHDVSDNKTLLGNRFNVTAGFDWKSSSKSVLGLAAHVSHMVSKNSDDMDLGYMPGVSIAGHNSTEVADTNIGIGGYLMHTLGTKARVYGNAFIDMHLFDVSRQENYVSDIDGFGTAFSLISEWGLMHDWLNQYVVGNLYARVGYNFGFSVREDADDEEYMHLTSDGYAIFTPGYSLIAQKRIYTSPWFQIRPYASIGVEYDVLGMPDVTKYKFASARSYTEYEIDHDPLWTNIGCGLEMLSAGGYQVGFDYRYQYNEFLQIHNLRLSGSYRF